MINIPLTRQTRSRQSRRLNPASRAGWPLAIWRDINNAQGATATQVREAVAPPPNRERDGNRCRPQPAPLPPPRNPFPTLFSNLSMYSRGMVHLTTPIRLVSARFHPDEARQRRNRTCGKPTSRGYVSLIRPQAFSSSSIRFSMTRSTRPNSLAPSAVKNWSRSSASSIFLSG
jgi:hypothetical protein